MSKIKKISISILIGIMIIFGIQSISNAYSVGQELNISYDKYINSKNIFCVERNQALNTYNNYYEIVSNVKIKGNKSTDHTGKTVESNRNTKFAYILSKDNGENHDEGPVQNGVWSYARVWMGGKGGVGKQHAGLYNTFASTVQGDETTENEELLDDATKYATEYLESKKVTDNTNKEKISVQAYEKDGKQYIRIGPFNWTFGGKLTRISMHDQDGVRIADKLYSIFDGETEKWISMGKIESNQDFYISIPADKGVTKITKVSGDIQLDVKEVNIWFLKSIYGDKQNLIIVDPDSQKEKFEFKFDYNIPLLGNLKVIKVNKDNEVVTLSGVGFYIQNKNTGKYVNQATDGTISYVDSKEEATEFITDAQGKISIENLIVGTYVAYETKNPNYGYEIISEGKEATVTIDKTAELKIPNKQKYIKLSGYVWVDNISGKKSGNNNLYDNNGSEDKLLDGIIVRLMDKTTGQMVKKATTENGGKYLFTDVLVDDLDKYYIEFEYDGLTYTNVVPHIDKDNGSKSAESSEVRNEFNGKFSVVEGVSNNTGKTLDKNGEKAYDLTYNVNNHVATLDRTKASYNITANTDEAKYSIKEHFVPGQEEIKYINLGLYVREQPDIALLKDIQNVRVSVNGYEHVYEWSQRFKNQGVYEQGFNVGVKFGEGENQYGKMQYTQPIYKADYEYNSQDNSKELKVYITYKIRLVNESTDLSVKVNNIVDYFDAKYNIKNVVKLVKDKNGNITTKGVTYTEPNNKGNYKETIINTNTIIDPESYADFHVEFELNEEAKLNILNDRDNLSNVAEINSYSVFDKDGNAYAGIDKDSNPGNTVPGQLSTYEDDTDSAPGLKLEVAKAREMTGKVFLDSTSGELMTGDVRQGSGAYEKEEKGIEGVLVTLRESGSGKEYTDTTDSNGDFLIEDYIPGDYTLTYTWGDKTYFVDENENKQHINVNDYKGTVYDSSRKQDNPNWYKENVSTRLSDALDNYQTRIEIDQGKSTENKMNSTTPVMGIGVEYETTYTASSGDEYTYRIENIDFGIVERARQELAIDKKVESVEIILANGQKIASLKYNEEGKIESTKGIVYIPATPGNNGMIKAELDSELIQGATVNVKYAIAVNNNSELDYDTEEYYLYGKTGTEDQIIRYIPSEIYDYIDNTLAVKENTNWEITGIDKYNENNSEVTTLEKYIENQDTGYEYFKEWYNINEWSMESVKQARGRRFADKTILYNKENIEVSPGTSQKLAELNASKILTNTDDISLNNDVEITKVIRKGDTGRNINVDYLYDSGETVTITPPTGENKDYILISTLGITFLITLGAGIVLIKKKIL